MRKLIPVLLICFGVSGALAQSPRDGVTMSNDPAKVAAVEKHAQELKARAAQQAQAVDKQSAKAKKPSAKSKAKAKSGASAKPAATK